MNLKKVYYSVSVSTIVVFRISPCQAMENENDKIQEEMKPSHGRLRHLMARTEEKIKEANLKGMQNKRDAMSKEDHDIERKRQKSYRHKTVGENSTDERINKA